MYETICTRHVSSERLRRNYGAFSDMVARTQDRLQAILCSRHGSVSYRLLFILRHRLGHLNLTTSHASLGMSASATSTASRTSSEGSFSRRWISWRVEGSAMLLSASTALART